MTIGMGGEPEDDAAAPAEVEAALRWLARRKDGEPLHFFLDAIENPAGEPAAVLRCLVSPTASLAPELRAYAVWGLLVDEIGVAANSRRRHTLMAAFRIPPAPGGTAWKATLGDRFRQLMLLPGVFGDPPPTTPTPMHQAWKLSLAPLAASLGEKLAAGPDWPAYISIGRAAAEVATWRARAASQGAQPVFIERMLITAVMHRRTIRRRITERDIIACEDGVDGYDTHAAIGWEHDPEDLPVTALWGCRVVASPWVNRGDPIQARLRFRRTLRKGERYTFVSEALDGQLDEERRWLNVDIDHHGIEPGGLTIQLSFDAKHLPEACWWYAEQLEFERTRKPPDGDPHLIPVGDGFVRHTFADGCHPRESYGIAFRWKSS
ncbi:hypothetical protein SAMN05421837_1156 [Amycolatopsis pretoriensis]|uniref:Uncharacterized protein n=1 Tax=Amycolatopsis pretoriensis TaxID=218821 RepID=A0A1H5RH02_9PSEU|nr:hypothetical protein [Amycolatopsis pretoriensis]SEF37655.1 hypothetical protein SAMN05421837_1156 [Amycolatopsis pretoriensis]